MESIIDKHQAKDEAFQSKQNTIRKKKFDLSSETTCCRENMKETTSILSFLLVMVTPQARKHTWNCWLSAMMGKKELKQKAMKLSRNSNATRSGIFTCKEFELWCCMVELTCTKNQPSTSIWSWDAYVSNDQLVRIGGTFKSIKRIGLMSWTKRISSFPSLLSSC